MVFWRSWSHRWPPPVLVSLFPSFWAPVDLPSRKSQNLLFPFLASFFAKTQLFLPFSIFTIRANHNLGQKFLQIWDGNLWILFVGGKLEKFFKNFHGLIGVGEANGVLLAAIMQIKAINSSASNAFQIYIIKLFNILFTIWGSILSVSVVLGGLFIVSNSLVLDSVE